MYTIQYRYCGHHVNNMQVSTLEQAIALLPYLLGAFEVRFTHTQPIQAFAYATKGKPAFVRIIKA